MKHLLLMVLLLCCHSSRANLKPADGLWNTTDDPAIGSGLMLSTQGELTIVSVFTYDAEGNNVWYLASGKVDDNGVFAADLLQSQNGGHILAENPTSAELTETARTIQIEFRGSQIGTLSIDESHPKTIHSSHFGFYTSTTEQIILDNSPYRMPYLGGQFVLGDVTSSQSYILDLRGLLLEYPYQPNRALTYTSVHSSTDHWSVYCPTTIADSIQPYCRVRRGNGDELPELRIDLTDLGNQRMTLYQNEVEPHEEYQAFRLKNDRRLLPADGYWRTADDPAIGSGVVMRTQGEFTVVLIYSYDDAGRAEWQIASGQFDENGLLETDLYTPQGGSALEGSELLSGQAGESVALRVQLQGTNLATFSIDGTEPKELKSFVYGFELFVTLHKTIEGEPFTFSDQQGAWLLVDEQYSDSRISILSPFDLNWSQSPPDPRLYESRQYEDLNTDDDFRVTFFCTKILSFGDLDFEVKPYCHGRHFIRPSSGGMKLYYEDIGADEFRYYYDESTSSHDVNSINRESQMFHMFRLAEE